MSTIAGAQDISFRSPVDAYLVGGSHYPATCRHCLASADFNRDGKPDLIFSYDGYAGPAVVLLGNGNGSFRLSSGIPSQSETHIGDYNGDGIPDVATSPYSIFLGKGDGTFSDRIAVPSPGVQFDPPLLVADLDGDGLSDLITTGYVVLPNRDGSFRRVGVAMEGTPVAVADFTRDGIPDLVVLSAAGQVTLLQGRGDGTFLKGIPVLGVAFAGSGFVTGDFNGDGRMDLAGLSQGKLQLMVLPGNGNGTFGPVRKTELSAVRAYVADARFFVSAAADFNIDGKLDLVVGDGVFAGNGDGTFRAPVFFGVTTHKCGGYGVENIPCSANHEASVVADFDGDGRPDIAAGITVASYSRYTDLLVSLLVNEKSSDGFTSAGVSSASGRWPVAGNSLVSAYGRNLAPRTEAAEMMLPLPTTLGGIRLHIIDRSRGDTLAPLLFVSPTQINYVMTSTEPFAYVALERVGSAYAANGMTVPIVPIAPGLFPVALSIRGGNPTPIISFTLLGTGFGQPAVDSVHCSANGTAVQVGFVGPLIGFPELDQIGVLVPRSLGPGKVSLVCSFGDGLDTNVVEIAVQ